MPYQYASNRNFEDYASGRVLYALPGQPAFPVRLASEILQRALGHWHSVSREGCCRIYDPVCGAGYWLVALGYLHWEFIAAIYASDINTEVLSVAEWNLALLTLAGLERRIDEIETLLENYGKPSHAAALESAHWFRQQLSQNLESHAIDICVFQADATDSISIGSTLEKQSIDLVLADVPYGWRTQWAATEERNQPETTKMLQALHPFLKPGSVVAIAADKRQKIQSEDFQRLERFQIGKRRIEFWRPFFDE
jgi:16S rRNA G966 N2-methylase RsmD